MPKPPPPPVTVHDLNHTHMPMLREFIIELNPHLPTPVVVERLDNAMATGQRFLGAFLNNNCVGVLGFWFAERVYCGKHMHIDSFVVRSEIRGAGVGAHLMDAAKAMARDHGCEAMILDVYLNNTDAHAFYEREGFTPKGYHFLREVTP